MTVLQTERLRLRELTVDDAAFVLELLNEPAWLRFIGDRGVRSLADARGYIESGPRASYARHGYGLYAVELLSQELPIGICGLVRRDSLPEADLGFALLERHWGHGYAPEASVAVLRHASAELGLRRVLAVTSPDNERSIRVLEDLDFAYEGRVTLPPASEELLLFAWTAPAPAGRAADADAQAEYACPACGERIVVPIDVLAGAEQEYVEDCPVCCAPLVLSVHVDPDGRARIEARGE